MRSRWERPSRTRGAAQSRFTTAERTSSRFKVSTPGICNQVRVVGGCRGQAQIEMPSVTAAWVKKPCSTIPKADPLVLDIGCWPDKMRGANLGLAS